MANYEIIAGSAPGQFGTGVLIKQEIAKPGHPVIAAQVLTLPASCVGNVYLQIGQTKQPIRINVQGNGWEAPVDPATGKQIPEVNGVYLRANDIAQVSTDFPTLEVYVETPDDMLSA